MSAPHSSKALMASAEYRLLFADLTHRHGSPGGVLHEDALAARFIEDL